MMMRVKETARIGFTSLFLSAALLIASGFAIGVVGQETQSQKPATTKRAVSGGRDPFRKYEAPVPTVKRIAGQAAIPSIQDRIALYKAQKVAAMNARLPAPKPTTASLLSEIQRRSSFLMSSILANRFLTASSWQLKTIVSCFVMRRCLPTAVANEQSSTNPCDNQLR